MTPRQIASLKDSLGEDEDASELDGFEEISEENQEKVRQAVAQGHVADEDWRGVCFVFTLIPNSTFTDFRVL